RGVATGDEQKTRRDDTGRDDVLAALGGVTHRGSLREGGEQPGEGGCTPLYSNLDARRIMLYYNNLQFSDGGPSVCERSLIPDFVSADPWLLDNDTTRGGGQCRSTATASRIIIATTAR